MSNFTSGADSRRLRNSETQRLRGSEAQKLRGSEAQRLRDTETQRYRNCDWPPILLGPLPRKEGHGPCELERRHTALHTSARVCTPLHRRLSSRIWRSEPAIRFAAPCKGTEHSSAQFLVDPASAPRPSTRLFLGSILTVTTRLASSIPGLSLDGRWGHGLWLKHSSGTANL